MVYIRSSIFFIFLFCFAIEMQSCSLQEHQIKAEYLFSIPLGVLPGEFKAWKDTAIPYRNSLFMKNGVFYIGNIDRIMVFSSTGLLLNFISPSHASSNGSILQYSNNAIPYYSYPIGIVGKIVANSSGKIIFSNTLILEAKFNINDYAVVQLLIYDHGEMKKIIGRIGKEQFNFLSIKDIFIRDNSQVAVLNMDKESSTLYFFDKKGYMIKNIFFQNERLPIYPQKRYKETIGKNKVVKPILMMIIPSPNREIVYVHVNYYDFISDGNRKNIQKIQFRRSVVYTVNVRSGMYNNIIDLPFINSSHVLKKVMSNGNMVFLDVEMSEKYKKQYFSVVLVSAKGKELRHYNLFFPIQNYLSYQVALDGSGKLGAYFIRDEKVDVFWWNVHSFSVLY